MEPRTVDRILGGEGLPSPEGAFGWSVWPKTHVTPDDAWIDLSSPVVVIDNVAEYVFQHLLNDSKAVNSVLDLPSIAPPFPNFWLDVSSSLLQSILPWDFHKWAIFVYAIRIDPLDDDRDDDAVKGLNVVQAMVDETKPGPEGDRLILDPEIRWLVEFTLFVDFGKRGRKRKRIICGPITPTLVQLDEYGFIISRDENGVKNTGWINPNYIPTLSNPNNEWHHATASVEPIDMPGDLDEEIKAYLRLLTALLYPGFFALGLMHCRNVEMTEQVPTPKEQKTFRKRNQGKQLNSFHVLMIDPMRRTAKAAGEPLVTGQHRDLGLHIVRGHFKTYTKERPLLGRAVGTFWWPQHLRGDEDQGIVAKDYAVKAS